MDLNLSFRSIDRQNALQFLRQGAEQIDTKEDCEIGDAEVLRVAASIIKNCVPDCCQVRCRVWPCTTCFDLYSSIAANEVSGRMCRTIILVDKMTYHFNTTKL